MPALQLAQFLLVRLQSLCCTAQTVLHCTKLIRL